MAGDGDSACDADADDLVVAVARIGCGPIIIVLDLFKLSICQKKTTLHVPLSLTNLFSVVLLLPVVTLFFKVMSQLVPLPFTGESFLRGAVTADGLAATGASYFLITGASLTGTGGSMIFNTVDVSPSMAAIIKERAATIGNNTLLIVRSLVRLTL
jgi:hypothetical protein